MNLLFEKHSRVDSLNFAVNHAIYSLVSVLELSVKHACTTPSCQEGRHHQDTMDFIVYKYD